MEISPQSANMGHFGLFSSFLAQLAPLPLVKIAPGRDTFGLPRIRCVNAWCQLLTPAGGEGGNRRPPCGSHAGSSSLADFISERLPPADVPSRVFDAKR